MNEFAESSRIATSSLRRARTRMMILLFGLVSVTRTLAAPVLSAQSADTTVARASLFTRNDAYLGAAFVAGTIALRPLDKSIARRLQNPNTQTNRTLQNLATDVRLIASPGSLIIGGSLYAVGRLGHHDRLADLGLHGLEAIIVGSVLNTGVKWTAGRARPYVVGDSNPNDYVFLRGLRKGNDYQSFPSGHSVAAFAAAAVVTSEATRWYPRTKWYIGTAMYAGASAVALSRLYNNQHWASDVIVGAGIGTFAGNKVVRFNHSTELGNRIDRWLLPTSVVPDARGGVSLGWTVAPGFGSQ